MTPPIALEISKRKKYPSYSIYTIGRLRSKFPLLDLLHTLLDVVQLILQFGVPLAVLGIPILALLHLPIERFVLLIVGIQHLYAGLSLLQALLGPFLVI